MLQHQSANSKQELYSYELNAYVRGKNCIRQGRFLEDEFYCAKPSFPFSNRHSTGTKKKSIQFIQREIDSLNKIREVETRLNNARKFRHT